MKVKLKELCEIQSGGTPNRSNKQYWDNGTINWAKISDIKDKYLFNTEEKITEEGLKNSSAKLFKKNSILYTIFATLGEACILGIDTTTNQAIANLEIRDKNVETEYIYYYLLSKKKLISGIGRGVAQNNINLSILKEMEINLADITTQKRIVDILNQNESIINKYKKQIALLDTLIKARFVEMFGDLNNTKYDIKTIEECAIFVKDGTHNTPMYTEDKVNGFKFLSSKDVTSGKIDWSNIKYIPKELHNELYERIKPQKNDILLAKNGTTGICAIVDNDEIFDIYVSLALIRLKEDLNPTYIWTIINSYMVKEQFNKSLKGIGVPNLHLSEIKKVNLIVPPIGLQNSFAAFVKEVDKLKFDVQKSLEKTQMLFDSLMQEYFG